MVEGADLSVTPPVEAALRRNPNASIFVSQNLPNLSTRQPFFYGKRSNGNVPKPIQAVHGRNPEVILSIFEEVHDLVARQTVSLFKRVHFSVM